MDGSASAVTAEEQPAGITKEAGDGARGQSTRARFVRDEKQVALFGEYLMHNLDEKDICVDKNGSKLFNLNQVAYIMEGSITNKQQNSTRKRLRHTTEKFKVNGKCRKSGKGVRFVDVHEAYETVVNCLRGPKVTELQAAAGFSFSNQPHVPHEYNMVLHIISWAQCKFIPMFTTRNRKVFAECSFRPDVAWEFPEICVMVECDEDAHKTYNKDHELIRMSSLLNAAEEKNIAHIVFIRFNPTLQGSTTQFKFSTLLSTLMNVFAKKNEYTECTKSIIYLFYPGEQHVWYLVDTLEKLLSNKHPRPADTTDGNATACSDASPTQT